MTVVRTHQPANKAQPEKGWAFFVTSGPNDRGPQ